MEQPGDPPPAARRLLISIKGYFALMNVVIFCLLFPSVSYFFYVRTAVFRDAQLEQAVNDQTAALKSRAAQLVRTLSHSGSQAIADYNFTFLNSLIEQAIASDEELVACQLFSRQTGSASAGTGLAGLNMQEIFTGTGEETPPTAPQPEALPLLFREHLAASSRPLLLARTPVYMGGRLWGHVFAAFSLEQRNRDIAAYEREWAGQMRQYRFFLLAGTILFFGLGVGVAVLFTRPLVRTIHSLRDGVQRVAGGNPMSLT